MRRRWRFWKILESCFSCFVCLCFTFLDVYLTWALISSSLTIRFSFSIPRPLPLLIVIPITISLFDRLVIYLQVNHKYLATHKHSISRKNSDKVVSNMVEACLI